MNFGQKIIDFYENSNIFVGNRQTNVKWKKIETLKEIDAFSYTKHHHSIKSDEHMTS